MKDIHNKSSPFMAYNFIDKEYHPVIEDYLADYVDNNLGSVERETFEEVLVHDDDLRKLTFSAKEGKKLLEQYRRLKFGDKPSP